MNCDSFLPLIGMTIAAVIFTLVIKVAVCVECRQKHVSRRGG